MNDDKRMTRRGWLSLAGLAGASLAASPLRADPGGPPAASLGPTKRCILLWLNGGPSHLDTFDPKELSAVRGSFSSIATRLPDARFNEHLPNLADLADQLTVIRSMTCREGNHQRAQYLAQTGYAANPTVAHPALGAWIARENSPGKAPLPGYISVGGPGRGAGFFGPSADPLVVSAPGQLPDHAESPKQVPAGRFERRLDALAVLEDSFESRGHGGVVAARRKVLERAVAMMESEDIQAFDIRHEPALVRTAYGDDPFGKGCLAARRLSTSGVPFVQVVMDGWDTHRDHFDRSKALLSSLDRGMSALIRDLRDAGQLESTLVVCMGEFGRSPKINGNGGRDHHPDAWSAVLCGGGAAAGRIIGATDERGAKVTSQPTSVADLYATIASLLGIAPSTSYESPLGRPIAISDGGRVVAEAIG